MKPHEREGKEKLRWATCPADGTFREAKPADTGDEVLRRAGWAKVRYSKRGTVKGAGWAKRLHRELKRTVNKPWAAAKDPAGASRLTMAQEIGKAEEVRR